MSAKRPGRSPLTVVFDIGGVLSAGYDPLPAVHDVTGGDRDAVAALYWAERAALDAGADPVAYYRALWVAAGTDDPTDEEILELAAADDDYWVRLHPESRALLHDLARAGVRIGLLSNAPATFAEAVREAEWAEVVALAVFSGEVRRCKPDPEIYEILLEEIKVHTGGVAVPRNVIYFDDKSDNVEGARARGLDAHLWPRNGSGEPDQAGWEIARRVLAGRGICLT